jgi:hypothetical protein
MKWKQDKEGSKLVGLQSQRYHIRLNPTPGEEWEMAGPAWELHYGYDASRRQLLGMLPTPEAAQGAAEVHQIATDGCRATVEGLFKALNGTLAS